MYSFDYGVFHLIFCCKIVSCVTFSFLGNSPLIWFYHNLFILIQLWLKMLKPVLLHLLVCFYLCMHVYLLQPTVKVRGQPAGVGSPSTIGPQGWHSGLEVWQQVPLPTEPSHWLAMSLLALYKSWHVPECMRMILFSYFLCIGCNHAVCTFWVCHFHLTCYCQTHPRCLCWGSLFILVPTQFSIVWIYYNLLKGLELFDHRVFWSEYALQW